MNLTLEFQAALAHENLREIRFDDLPVGAPFRLPECCGATLLRSFLYFKTGEASYGTRVGEPTWPWLEDAPFVLALSSPLCPPLCRPLSPPEAPT